MAQGQAKKVKGQQASADSAPVVLSTEQDTYLGNIAASTDAAANYLSYNIEPDGTAVATMYPSLNGAEDDSGNIEPLRSSAGSLFVRFASAPTVTANGQYVEDAAAAADPNGTPVMLIRKDTPAAVTSADGDNVAQRGSNYGGAYTHILDSEGNISNIEAKLDQVLRQLRSKPEMTPLGAIKVELQSTGTSPITLTSGTVTAVTSMGAAVVDQSFTAQILNNVLFRTQLSLILT